MKLPALALTLLIFPLAGFTQTLKTINDEYSKVQITSWEPMLKGIMVNFIVHVQCIKTGSDIELGLKLTWPNGAVDEGAELQFIMENDSIVTLNNSKFTLPCIGCGAIGFFGSGNLGYYLRFPIPPRAANDLATGKIKKLRLYMHDGYIEDNVKGKSSEIIKKELWLFR